MSAERAVARMDALATHRINWRALGVVALLHGLAGLSLLDAEPVVQALGREQLLTVSLIELAPTAPRPAEPPRPRATTAPEPAPRSPILSASSPDPAPMSASVPEATAKPGALEAAPSAPSAQAASATPAAVVPPRFDADYLNNPAPAYPALSRRLGEQGRVLLRVYVEPDGSAARVEVRTGSGFERLDSSAISAVRKWRFVPARQGSAAVGAWVVVPISFSLRS